MRSITPLKDHPEFRIIHNKSWSEYRVQSSRVLYDADSSFQRWFQCFWADAVICLCIAVLWPWLHQHTGVKVALTIALLLYGYSRCTRVLWESVVVLHTLGLQLETQRGLPSVPLFTSRRFIPLTTLQDFVINEGLRGWSVCYYLAVIQESKTGEVTIDVPFENILPRFPILLEVYHGVQELVFDIDSTVYNVTQARDE